MTVIMYTLLGQLDGRTRSTLADHQDGLETTSACYNKNIELVKARRFELI